jgi:multidrug transporter EmrE-like cation transporter
MRVEALVLILLAALLQAVANLLLRGGVLVGGGLPLDASFLLHLGRLIAQPLFLFGILFYIAAALVWFAALSLEDLSSSYPVLVGATFIFVGVGAVLFFQEAISLVRGLGIIVIVLGIVLVAFAP